MLMKIRAGSMLDRYQGARSFQKTCRELPSSRVWTMVHPSELRNAPRLLLNDQVVRGVPSHTSNWDQSQDQFTTTDGFGPRMIGCSVALISDVIRWAETLEKILKPSQYIERGQ
jgi:hypothetical protein